MKVDYDELTKRIASELLGRLHSVKSGNCDGNGFSLEADMAVRRWSASLAGYAKVIYPMLRGGGGGTSLVMANPLRGAHQVAQMLGLPADTVMREGLRVAEFLSGD